MRKRSGLLLLAVLMLLWAGPAARSHAETRSIYVGDVITLRVQTRAFSAEALREKFQAFEILGVQEAPGGYEVSLRTFETGAHVVTLGDKEVVISVRSTLEDIERDGIFEGDIGVRAAGALLPWRAFFYVAAGVFCLSGGFVLIRALLRKNRKEPSPHQLFLQCAAALSAEDGQYLVDLTRCFKEYIERLHQCRIIGKTSAEIVAELKGIQALGAALPEISAWLAACDRLKFAGVGVSGEEKRAQYGRLLDLVTKMNVQKEGAA